MIETTCPRCAGPLRAPGFWSSAWQCQRHGEVHPFHVAPLPSRAALDRLVADARVPVWVPQPLPPGWTVTGIGGAGDDRTGVVASVVALSGPCPTGGPADAVLVAEEPGVGLGSRFAGIDGPDPGPVPDGAPDVKVEAAGHVTALWRTPTGGDRIALVGESKARWLWAVFWPRAAAEVLERVELCDLADDQLPDLAVVFGAQSPRLAPRRTPDAGLRTTS